MPNWKHDAEETGPYAMGVFYYNCFEFTFCVKFVKTKHEKEIKMKWLLIDSASFTIVTWLCATIGTIELNRTIRLLVIGQNVIWEETKI